MKVAVYARVSTDDKHQDPETQLFAVREFCQRADWEIIQEYVDRARAKDFVRRKAWDQLRRDARQRKFKAVVVFRLDRAFRSVRETVNTLEEWVEFGIGFRSITEDVIDTTTGQGRFIMQIMAAMAELESSIISDRVSAGMARAKAQGKQIGRKPIQMALQLISDTLASNNHNISRAAIALGVSRAYIHKRLKEEVGLK